MTTRLRIWGSIWSRSKRFSELHRANDRGFTEDEETGLLRRETFAKLEVKKFEWRLNLPFVTHLCCLKKGPSRFGYDAFPGSADAAGRLEDDIKPNREAEQSLVRELVNRDNSRFSGRRRAYNEINNEIEADQISRDMYVGGGRAQFGDENIGRIAEIKSLGKVGETSHVVRTANDAIRGQVVRRHDGIYLDPVTGNPMAVQGPELPSVLAGDNTPNNGSTSDALNAPQTAQQWLRGAVPELQGDRMHFPQVDITRETTNLAQKVKDYGHT